MNATAPMGKVVPLIPRLASDKDGEVVATARAIQRQFAKAKLDLHDLAEMLKAAPPGRAQGNTGPVFADYAAAVEWLLATDSGELSAHEIRFIEDMQGILQSWPPRPKQAAWLRALVKKFGGRFDG
jgi:hypothetical protein